MGNGDESTRPSNVLDIEMGLDDLAPAPKPSRFQPKFKPKTKLIPKVEAKDQPATQPSNPLLPKKEDSVNIITKEEKVEVVEKKPVGVSVVITKDDKEEKIDKPMPDSVNATKGAEEDEVEKDPMDVDANAVADDGVGEDTVVREIDVFFNPLLDESAQLYVMQYPLRPCWRPYEFNDRCQEVRVNTKQSKLEVDLEMNVGTDNYNDEEEVPVPLRLQKQTLTSAKAPSVTSYAVGVLMGNKLILNPIHAVVQLRPSMAYVNAGMIQKKSNVSGSLQVTAKPDEGKLASKVSNEQNKEVIEGKLSSNEQNKEDIESWVPLEYHDVDSPISSQYQQRMAPGDSCNLQFSMTVHDYVNSLCPGLSNNGTSAKGPSIRFLLKLPLEERLKRWLSEGPHVHRFAALMHLAPAPENSVKDVLKVLQQHAILVRGLWVSKTSLRCEGAQALARDYILLLFTKNQFIHRDQLKILKVPNEIMKNILNSLAVERSTFRDWKFKEPEDLSFIKAHPDVVEAQKRAWSGREKYITEAVHGFGRKAMAGTPRNPSNPSLRGSGASSSTSDQRARGGLDEAQRSGSISMSNETQEALPKALLEIFHLHKVCSLQLISQGLRDMAVSKSTNPKADARIAVAAARGANAPLPELQSIISKVAINVHGLYVLKSLGDPKTDPLRTFVINLFIAKQPNAKLKKADIVEAAKIALKREVTNAEFSQVMKELCISSGPCWMLKSGDGRSR